MAGPAVAHSERGERDHPRWQVVLPLCGAVVAVVFARDAYAGALAIAFTVALASVVDSFSVGGPAGARISRVAQPFLIVIGVASIRAVNGFTGLYGSAGVLLATGLCALAALWRVRSKAPRIVAPATAISTVVVLALLVSAGWAGTRADSWDTATPVSVRPLSDVPPDASLPEGMTAYEGNFESLRKLQKDTRCVFLIDDTQYVLVDADTQGPTSAYGAGNTCPRLHARRTPSGELLVSTQKITGPYSLGPPSAPRTVTGAHLWLLMPEPLLGPSHAPRAWLWLAEGGWLASLVQLFAWLRERRSGAKRTSPPPLPYRGENTPPLLLPRDDGPHWDRIRLTLLATSLPAWVAVAAALVMGRHVWPA